MWARIIILQRTIHTPTLTMLGGETTPIFHGVTLRMCKLPKGSKEISNRKITIKLHHKRSNQIQSQRRITSKVFYSNLWLYNNRAILRTVKLSKIGGHYKSSYPKIGNTSGAVGQRVKWEKKRANSQWKLAVNKSSTTSKEKENKSFKVSWWLILVDITWRIGVLPIMSNLSQHWGVKKWYKEEGKEEQIEITHDLHKEKGKEVSTEVSSA